MIDNTFNHNSGDIGVERIPKKDIAIIGMSLKLPMANSLEQFWENLKSGRDCVIEFPKSRRNDSERLLNFADVYPDRNYYEAGYLDEVDKFDYKFFKLSPKEASLIDPCQRLFLQTAWQAIEDSGYGGSRLIGSDTGVFLGFCNNLKDTYGQMVYQVDPSSLQLSLTGNIPAITPSRISYALDLKGPTMVIDTACSSSLVSVHLACQAIRNGDCEMAIAGGVKLIYNPLDVADEKIGIESSDRKTKSFDDRSDGTGNGEGTVAIVLKPLNKALKDRDNIYAVIKGSAINQDGNSMGITAPNSLAQANVIEKAWKSAGVKPESISYIEAHGTGTKLGDPIEADGIERAFRKYTDKKQFCALGSAKTNIGHLYEGAGIVGILKTSLMLKYKEIPPIVHFQKPNRKINFEESPFFINDRLVKWETGGERRRCGINAFGFSGTNCHVILEEAPEQTVEPDKGNKARIQLFTMSAKSKEPFQSLILQYKALLEQDDLKTLNEICYTACTGRGHYNIRVAVTAKSKSELREKLDLLAGQDLDKPYSDKGIYFSGCKSYKDSKLVLHSDSMNTNNIDGLMKEKISLFVQLGKNDQELLNDIGRMYVDGLEIDWREIYKGEIIRKVSVPVYPFERIRCWIDIPEPKPMFEDTGMHYTVEWKKEYISGVGSNSRTGGVLIFLDSKSDGIANGMDLAAFYRNKGRKVIGVELGTEYKSISEDHYMIRDLIEDYERLFVEVKPHQVTSIIHVLTLSVTHEVNSVKELSNTQRKGLYSLYYITKSIYKCLMMDDIEIFLVSDYVERVTGNEERIKAENATLFGFAKIVERENPQIVCRCIDIDRFTGSDELGVEFISTSKFSKVAYREGSRFVEEFTEIDLNEVTTSPVEIKENGVYIVTGGAGGIGLQISKHIACQNRVNLIFINRSSMPERDEWDSIIQLGEDKKMCEKIKAMKEIEETGSKVYYFSADVSNMEDVKAILDKVREKHKKINGVIHCAGIPTEGFIVEKKEEKFTEVVSPKVQGTWILEKLTREDKLDFFVMCSSVASIFGAPGQGDYSAANAYLDSFAYHINMTGRKAVSINWVQWLETGMAVECKANIDTIFKALPTKQGVRSFEEVLNSNAVRVLVGEISYGSDMTFLLEKARIGISEKIQGNLNKHRNRMGKNASCKTGKVIAEVKLLGREDSIYTETERKLGQIWGEVLGYQEIGIYDNFYEMGGDSIIAMKIGSKLAIVFERNVNIVETMSYLTIFEFAEYLDKSLKTKKNVQDIYESLKPVEKREAYPLSSAQKRLFAQNQIAESKTNYNLPEVYVVDENFDVNKIEAAIIGCIDRHEILRTSFCLIEGEPAQVVHDSVDFKMEFVEMRDQSLDSVDVGKMVKDFVKPFKLDVVPLLRGRIVSLSDGKSIMMLDIHHIIYDAVSKAILMEEIIKQVAGEELEKVQLQYKDYAIWQNNIIKSNGLKEYEEYWLNVLSDGIQKLNIPTDFTRPVINSYAGDRHYFECDGSIRDLLNKIAVENGTTLYAVLLASFNVLLHKYSGQEDIIIGSPILGRGNDSLQNMMGMFVNMVAMRSFPSAEKVFADFLKEVRDNTVMALKCQEVQLEEIIEKLKMKREMNRNTLFDVVFALQNVRKPWVEGLIPYGFEVKTSKYDLTLEATDFGEKIVFSLEYSTDIFCIETVRRMSSDFLKVLDTVSEDYTVQIGKIKLENSFTKEEKTIKKEVEFSFE